MPRVVKAPRWATAVTLELPTPDRVREARALAGDSQEAAAEVIHLGSRVRWTEYENGTRQMPLASWELYLIKRRLRPF